MSLLVWQIVNQFIVEISLFSFILVEILIAISEILVKFVVTNAEGNPPSFKRQDDMIHPGNKAGEQES
jgi:hypothetical protein